MCICVSYMGKYISMGVDNFHLCIQTYKSKTEATEVKFTATHIQMHHLTEP